MYSQNNEEEIILKYYSIYKPTVTRFLDIGAYNGINFSNTYELTKRGWGGVCVEPVDKIFESLTKTHGENDKIQLIKCAVDDKETEQTFYECEDATSTFSPEWRDRWEGAGVKYTTKKLITVSMDSLFEKIGFDFSFINIDVEKNNISLFRTMDFSKFPLLQLLCIEHDNENKEIQNHLSEFGFTQLLFNQENIILGRKL